MFHFIFRNSHVKHILEEQNSVLVVIQNFVYEDLIAYILFTSGMCQDLALVVLLNMLVWGQNSRLEGVGTL